MNRKISALLVVLACLGILSGAVCTLPAAHAWLSDPPPPPIPPPPIPQPAPQPIPPPGTTEPPPPVHDTPEPSTLVLSMFGIGALGVRVLRRK